MGYSRALTPVNPSYGSVFHGWPSNKPPFDPVIHERRLRKWPIAKKSMMFVTIFLRIGLS